MSEFYIVLLYYISITIWPFSFILESKIMIDYDLLCVRV